MHTYTNNNIYTHRNTHYLYNNLAHFIMTQILLFIVTIYTFARVSRNPGASNNYYRSLPEPKR